MLIRNTCAAPSFSKSPSKKREESGPGAFPFFLPGASLVAQTAENLPVIQETQVQYLGGEVPLEKDMATH